MTTRPDYIDSINAFRAGFRHGLDNGQVSAREAEEALRSLPTTIPITADTVEMFCAGSIDGEAKDKFRYLLTYLPSQCV